MNRYQGDRSPKGLRPVKKIELSNKHIGLRIFFVVLAIIVAIGAFWSALNGLLSSKAGWTKIENYAVVRNMEDFSFQYYIGGKDGISATDEKKAVSGKYSELFSNAYFLFNADEEKEEFHNLWYINHHANELIFVDEGLHKALALIQEKNDKLLLLGPVYRLYRTLCYSASDLDAEIYDPTVNEEAANFVKQVVSFIENGDVKLEVYVENALKLTVSEAYQAFLKENGEENILDFGWTRNAFILDYLADGLLEEGYDHGIINSVDGFTRYLGKEDTSYEYSVCEQIDKKIFPIVHLTQVGKGSQVQLNARAIRTGCDEFYYIYKDGRSINSYLDLKDGMNKASATCLMGYSKDKSCADLLLSVMPVYVADSLDQSLIPEDVGVLWREGNVIYHTDRLMSFTVYEGDMLKLTKKKIR